jgi:Glycosyl transferases group 1
MSRTLAYVGNFKVPFTTENHIAQTLRGMGWTVRQLQEDGVYPSRLLEQVKGSDLFLFTRTWSTLVNRDHLRALKRMGIPSVSVHLDKYTGLKRDGGMETDPFWMTDICFTPEGSLQARRVFKDKGINQRYLPAGVYADECYMAEPVEEFKHDVVFVGGGSQYLHPEWPYRRQLVQWLQDAYGSRFGKYGYPEKTIRGAELNSLYASAKIVVGDTLCKDFMDSYYFSDRQFEVTGRGGFLITPYVAGITDYFVDRKEVVLYGYDNFVQLKNMIDYYLEHGDEREAIRLSGHERTKRDHTYTKRMEQMLGVLYQEGILA